MIVADGNKVSPGSEESGLNSIGTPSDSLSRRLTGYINGTLKDPVTDGPARKSGFLRMP